MFFRSTTGHETSNVPNAAGTNFNVAKSHEQHVANATWSEDLPSNTTMPAKLSSPISLNCKFSFLFMNLAHLYAIHVYKQKKQLSPDEFLPVAMNILIFKCSIHVPLMRHKEARKSKFQKERKVLMRKRTKLCRIILRTPQIISQLLYIEEQISSSHLKEKIHKEHVLYVC